MFMASIVHEYNAKVTNIWKPPPTNSRKGHILNFALIKTYLPSCGFRLYASIVEFVSIISSGCLHIVYMAVITDFFTVLF